jgi:hypothetical protein
MASTAPQNDWIEWTGGECPTPVDTMVDVKFRDGGFQDATEAGYWANAHDCFNMWKQIGSTSDIIAYRMVSA